MLYLVMITLIYFYVDSTDSQKEENNLPSSFLIRSRVRQIHSPLESKIGFTSNENSIINEEDKEIDTSYWLKEDKVMPFKEVD